MILYNGYQVLDAWGPLDLLNSFSVKMAMNLTIISPDGLPVATRANTSMYFNSGSHFDQVVRADHSLANAPPLDVLIVPGGIGNRYPTIQPVIDFVKERYPSLKYLLTVCTGAGIAARAGVLDGKNATTNKYAFYEMANLGPRTWWHAKARWVVDGNIWTSSGVSAGMDLTLAWIQHMSNSTVAEDLAIMAEYDWHRDPSWDPFSTHFGLVDVKNGVTMTAAAPTATPAPSTGGLPASATPTTKPANIAKPRPYRGFESA